MRWLGATAAVPGVGKAVRMLGRPLADLLGKPKAASVVEMAGDATTAYMLYRCLMLPWELPQVMDADEVHQGMQELAVFEAMRRGVAGVSDVSLQICALDFQWYLRNQLLRDSDWASMAHSVELRTPLVDAELLRDIMRLRAAGYLPSKTDFCEAVNPQIHALLKDRPKTGFSIPVAQWMPAKLRASAHRANPYRAWARYVFGAVQ
jgi:asparagine synthase (glutamine-hydrolysing)